MKKYVLIFCLFVFLDIFLGYTHGVYLDEHSAFVLVDDLVKNDYSSFIEHYPMFCQTPATQLISAFFKLLIPGILGYRFFLVLAHLLLFFSVFYICRLMKLSDFDSSFISFFISCSFPVLYIYHFVYAEPLSLLFFILAIYFYLRKDYFNSSFSSLISFLSKQLGITSFSLILFDFFNKKIKLKQFVGYSLVILVPLVVWIYFVYATYGNFLSPCSHKLEFNPLILMGKLGWLIGITGFYCLPFLFELAKDFFKGKKYLFLILFVLLPFSLEFFGSRSYITETENFKIHGSIPLFYHVLPSVIYNIFIFFIFAAGIFYLSSLKKNYLAFIFLSAFLLLALLGGENQPIAEIRHTVYLFPVIIFSLVGKYKLTNFSKLTMFLFVLYSLLWAYFLVGLANASETVGLYLKNAENGSCYYSNLPIYKFDSVCGIDNASFIVSAPGFSESIELSRYNLNKSFSVLPGFYRINIYQRK